MILETRLNFLLRQAKKVGWHRKRSAAEKLYRNILVEAPDSVEAHFGLAETTLDMDERTQLYSQILELEPDNEQAQAALRGEDIESLFVIAQELDDDDEHEEQTEAEERGDGGRAENVRTMSAGVETKLDTKKKDNTKHDSVKKKKRKTAVSKKEVAQKETTDDNADDEKSGDIQHCYRHHDTPTSLRCYDCDKLICIKCANKTPVGYICPECKRDLENTYYTAKPTDYLIALAVSLPLSIAIGAMVVMGSNALGFWALFIMSAVGGFIGNLIGRAVKAAIGKRRGRYIPHLVAATVGLGVSWGFLLLFGNILGMIVLGLYIFVAGGAAFYWSK